MFKVIFSGDEKTDRKIKRVATVMAILAGLGTFGSWIAGVYDPWNTTHKETVEIHDREMKKKVYAEVGSVNHLANMMVDEQVGDAQETIDAVEELERKGLATEKEIVDKENSKKRIEREFKPRYLCEPGMDREHYQQKHGWMPWDDVRDCIAQDEKRKEEDGG